MVLIRKTESACGHPWRSILVFQRLEHFTTLGRGDAEAGKQFIRALVVACGQVFLHVGIELFAR